MDGLAAVMGDLKAAPFDNPRTALLGKLPAAVYNGWVGSLCVAAFRSRMGWLFRAAQTLLHATFQLATRLPKGSPSGSHGYLYRVGIKGIFIVHNILCLNRRIWHLRILCYA